MYLFITRKTHTPVNTAKKEPRPNHENIKINNLHSFCGRIHFFYLFLFYRFCGLLITLWSDILHCINVQCINMELLNYLIHDTMVN